MKIEDCKIGMNVVFPFFIVYNTIYKQTKRKTDVTYQ